MKAGLWETDWFLGAVVVLVVLVFNRSSDLIPSLEQKAYDLGVQSTSRLPSDKVAVIAIDDTSIANIGRWPWSREIHARMTDLLASAKTKVIANTVFFSEPQIDPGYVYITKLLDLATPTPEMAPIVALLKEAEQTLNTDRRLAESYVKAGNVLLPVFFSIDIPRGRPDRPLPEYFLKNAVPAKIGDDFGALATAEVQMPVELIGRRHVQAATGAQALGREADVPAVREGGRNGRLVRRLVPAEADVAVRAEDPALPVLGRELGKQCVHRPAHEVLVDGLVLLPVGLGVVGLEALVELDRFCGPAPEHHRAEFSQLAAGASRDVRGRRGHARKGGTRSRGSR